MVARGNYVRTRPALAQAIETPVIDAFVSFLLAFRAFFRDILHNGYLGLFGLITGGTVVE